MTTTTMAERTEEKLAALDFMGQVADIDIQVREFHSDWVLLTYDLPNTKEGTDARYKFLRMARYAGAIQHTESVYMIPWSNAVNGIIAELSSIGGGQIFVFHTKVDEVQAVDLTNRYDDKLEETIESIMPRIPRINEHIADDHEQQARRMINKTWDMVQPMITAVAVRGDENLAGKVAYMVKALRQSEADLA